MRLQQSKSEHIAYSPHYSSTNNNISNTYLIDNKIIQHTNTVRDLGLILTSDNKWTNQTKKIYSKTITLNYTILYSFKSNKLTTYVQLFKSYIRPIIEYNSSIYKSHLKSDIRKIESIQSKYTRGVCQKLNIKFKDYHDRLQILNMETLEIRRIKSDLIITYKLLHNIIDIGPNNLFTTSNLHQNYNLRRHRFYLNKPELSKTIIRRNFLSQRIISTWNKLPEHLVMSESLEIFKNKLDLIDISLYAELII